MRKVEWMDNPSLAKYYMQNITITAEHSFEERSMQAKYLQTIKITNLKKEDKIYALCTLPIKDQLAPPFSYMFGKVSDFANDVQEYLNEYWNLSSINLQFALVDIKHINVNKNIEDIMNELKQEVI